MKVYKLLCFSIVCSMSFSAYALAQTYKFDPYHSSVTWQVNHFGLSNISGKWYMNGSIVYDVNKPQDATIKAVIDIQQLVTGIPELNYNLLGSAFLGANRYPQATFVSTQVQMLHVNSALVTGKLTLHGVTQVIVLKVTLNGVKPDQFNNKLTAGFSASGSILRSTYGINTYIPQISDTVNLDIQVEAPLSGKTL